MVRFDPNEVEEVGGGFEPIPGGWYRLLVDGALLKDTQNGGQKVSVKFSVLDYKNGKRKLFTSFNIVNKSEDAQKIGRGQLKRFLRVLGITTQVDVTDAWLASNVKDKVLYGKVEEVKHYLTGEPDNKITDFNTEPKAAPATKAVSKPKANDDLDQVPF